MAAVAVLALIACAFVAFAPSGSADGLQTSTEPADVTYITGSASLDGTAEYYIPNTDAATDAALTLTAASTVYVAPGAVFTLTATSAIVLTVNIATDSWTTETEGAPHIGNNNWNSQLHP